MSNNDSIHTLNRWVVYPTSGSTACLGLSMAPESPAKLEELVKVMKRNLQDTTIPVCAAKLTKGGKFTALEVPMWPTPHMQLKSWPGDPVWTRAFIKRSPVARKTTDLKNHVRQAEGHNVQGLLEQETDPRMGA
jgi:hypothetical protein